MKVALWAWHVPYLYLLARALPEVEWLALPTRYNPSGWDDTQRPRPANVMLDSTWALADVVIAQTPNDLAELLIAPDDLKLVYLAHNHWSADRTPPERLAALHARLVCISDRKARSWRDYGMYDDEIEVIPPGIDLVEYADDLWTGEGGYLLTVVNGLGRPLFDKSRWLRLTARREVRPEGRREVRLVGSGNERIPGAVGPAPSWDALKREYRRCALYLNPTRPPFEDTYNLAALEAAACGAPIRNLHGDPPHVEDFPIEAFRERWRKVLSEVTNG